MVRDSAADVYGAIMDETGTSRALQRPKWRPHVCVILKRIFYQHPEVDDNRDSDGQQRAQGQTFSRVFQVARHARSLGKAGYRREKNGEDHPKRGMFCGSAPVFKEQRGVPVQIYLLLEIGFQHILGDHSMGAEKRSVQRDVIRHHIHPVRPVLVKKGKDPFLQLAV